MTLNGVIKRISEIATGHKQVRTFARGQVTDFTTDRTTKYPAVFMQDTAGKISMDGHAITVNYRLFFLDLVNVSENTKQNELDVLSDMLSVAADILAQINNNNFDDWRLSSDNNLQFVSEGDDGESNGDMVAGLYVDISMRTLYTQNICAVPTTFTDYIPTDNTDMKLVYDKVYSSVGTEGTVLNIPEVVGKKIILVTRENAPIYRVSNAPDSAEYTWNDIVITLGRAVVNPGERFLILYRNY